MITELNKFEDLSEYLQAWEAPYIPTARAINEYEASINKFTVGWGFTTLDGMPVKLGMPLSLETANFILNRKIMNFVRELNVKDPDAFPLGKLVDNQDAAIIALAYNMGCDAFPKLLECYKNKDLDGTFKQFFNCIYEDDQPLEDLIYRRACDAQIFSNGTFAYRRYITHEEYEIFEEMNPNYGLPSIKIKLMDNL